MTKLKSIRRNYSPPSQLAEGVWPDLKHAIANSSGFKRWIFERGLDAKAPEPTLDGLVRAYLRQTLETLAY